MRTALNLFNGIPKEVQKELVGTQNIALYVELDDGLCLLNRFDNVQYTVLTEQIEHDAFPKIWTNLQC